MGDNYFTGSLESLVEYWQNEERAEKFMSGGTRTNAVQFLLNRAEVEIHKGLWIDTAVGTGFVQSKLYENVMPSLMVGIDVSRAMLVRVDEPVARIQGSTFNLPIRKNTASLVTNIFCFSDYPDPSKGFDELARICHRPGVVMFLDYSNQDGYWTARKEQHDGEEIVGNINLRNPDSIGEYLPQDLRVVDNIVIEYEVEATQFDNRVSLPSKFNRAFIFIELYKPRSA